MDLIAIFLSVPIKNENTIMTTGILKQDLNL